MPGKWQELREARVSIAVRIGDEPDTGAFSVFLPTLLQTGSATHVNAPFFADMSRTSIDFEHVYNLGLLNTARDLALEVIRTELAGQGEIEAQLIVDLLSPKAGNVGYGKQWLDGMIARLSASSAARLIEQPWFLLSSKWSTLDTASLFKHLPQPTVFTEARLREHVTFGVFHACLSSRSDQLQWLSQACGFSVYPRQQDLAETAEVIAGVIHKAGKADWNAFWSELRQLLPDSSAFLMKRKVLLGRDGVLHSAGEDCTVFFAPRRGVGDEEELADDADIIEIPPMLQPHVAFLHDSITLYDEHNRQTETRRYLGDRLVNRFRVEDIFEAVLIARTPPLPVRLKSVEGALCADILRWGLRLLLNLVERGIGEQTTHLLEKLAVPCAGGWYRAIATAYGPGWPDSHGDTLAQYLAVLSSEDCKEAARRLLLSPDRPEWGGRAVRYRDLLNAAGVFDGLRLNEIDARVWDSEFYANSGYFALPEGPPAGIPTRLWDSYRQLARSEADVHYGGTFRYRMETLYAIPGMEHYDRLDVPARRALMDLILTSLCQWPEDWQRVYFRKMSGAPNTPSAHSPLWYVLNQLTWMGFGSGDQTQWSAPPERWHIPASALGGRSWQFDHLHPLPPGFARRLDFDTNLASALRGLGMPQYDTETNSASLQLLNALAAAAESDEIRDQNVFLGQVRSAWGVLTPVQTAPRLPRKLIVQQDKRFLAVTPTIERPVYIPDSARSFMSSLERFGLPVLAIAFFDANRLASAFISAYGEAVVLTSTLEVQAVADGEVWRDGETESLRDSELDWAIEVCLTLAAHLGPSGRGTGTARFAEQVQAFRGARVAWCEKLSTRLTTGAQVFEQEVSCLWLSEDQTLLITRSCREDPPLLSEALASILERDDLTYQLMFVLGEIGAEGDSEVVTRVLEKMRLRPMPLRHK